MLICMSILIYILIQTQSDQTFTHVGKNLIDRVIVWMSRRKPMGVNMKLVVIIIYHGIYLVCATSHIDHILTSHILLVYATKVSSNLDLKTFCDIKRFAKGSSHENSQRIGKRA